MQPQCFGTFPPLPSIRPEICRLLSLQQMATLLSKSWMVRDHPSQEIATGKYCACHKASASSNMSTPYSMLKFKLFSRQLWSLGGITQKSNVWHVSTEGHYATLLNQENAGPTFGQMTEVPRDLTKARKGTGKDPSLVLETQMMSMLLINGTFVMQTTDPQHDPVLEWPVRESGRFKNHWFWKY